MKGELASFKQFLKENQFKCTPERETILKMNKELNARSPRGGARERAIEPRAEGVEE